MGSLTGGNARCWADGYATHNIFDPVASTGLFTLANSRQNGPFGTFFDIYAKCQSNCFGVDARLLMDRLNVRGKQGRT